MGGCGDSDAEAELDHDKNLCALMERCRAVKLRLSEKKVAIQTESGALSWAHIISGRLTNQPRKNESCSGNADATGCEGCSMIHRML